MINISFAYVTKLKEIYYEKEIISDSSESGWGGVCNQDRTHGFWTHEERHSYINYLELMAGFNALKCFAANDINSNILLRKDNTTAIWCINKMSSVKHAGILRIPKEIWQWCQFRNP